MGAAQIAILILMALSLGLSAWALGRDKPPVWRFTAPKLAPDHAEASFETIFEYAVETGQAHSPAIVLQDGGFHILWFEGSAEAQADVDLYHAAFRKDAAGWQLTRQGPRITRGALSRVMEPAQLVVTLGNTVDQGRASGDVYSTIVSVGGWAMASVADVRVSGDGLVKARKLNLSPFLNRSHLVKSPVVRFADGSTGLPAYFELGSTHGVLVRLGVDGRVRDSVRIDGPGKPIQPMIVPLSDTRAVAWLRDFEPSGKLLISHSDDGGQSWTPAVPTAMPNPSAPVAAVALGDGRILMAANDDPDGGDRLRLLLSKDEGETWSVLREIAENGDGARYPMLRLLEGGEIILTYSVGNKQGLRVQVFNSAWVAAQ